MQVWLQLDSHVPIVKRQMSSHNGLSCCSVTRSSSLAIALITPKFFSYCWNGKVYVLHYPSVDKYLLSSSYVPLVAGTSRGTGNTTVSPHLRVAYILTSGLKQWFILFLSFVRSFILSCVLSFVLSFVPSFFVGPPQRNMEVPRLGVKSEL